jgi:hypothetical protein
MTTGAKLQSTASALNVGGARVVAAVVLGRVIDVRDPRRKLELGSGSAGSALTSTSAASSDAKGRAMS